MANKIYATYLAFASLAFFEKNKYSLANGMRSNIK